MNPWKEKPMKRFLALAGIALMLAAPASAHSTPDEDANRALVLRFYDAVVNAKDVEAARSMVGEQYIQHNPQAADGVAGMEKFIAFLKGSFPDARSEVKRSFVDGNHVILHVLSRRVPGERGRAIMEIFRVSDGKVAEHWDVIQDVPETALNTNTMF